jgi:hypothetical protein
MTRLAADSGILVRATGFENVHAGSPEAAKASPNEDSVGIEESAGDADPAERVGVRITCDRESTGHGDIARLLADALDQWIQDGDGARLAARLDAVLRILRF